MTTGFTREEMIDFAKSVAPKGIRVDVVEDAACLSLEIDLDFGVGKSSSFIPKTIYSETTPYLEKKILESLRERTKDSIKQAVSRYCEHYFKMVAEYLELEDRLRREDEIYCVGHSYTIQKGHNFSNKYNLDHFYDVKARQDISNYDAIWRKLALQQFQHKHSIELFEYMYGSLERYKHALFSQDILAELLAKVPDNDIVFLVNFHFYYFITVLKALGDTLAWVLNYFYSLGLESAPSDIDLTKTRFRDKLKTANEPLFKKICEGSLYEKYRLLRDFRDIVVHRHALHVIIVQVGKDGPKKIMVPIDPTTGVMVNEAQRQPGLAIATNKESVAKLGLKEIAIYLGAVEQREYEDVVDFCNTHLKYISTAYTETIAEILLSEGVSKMQPN